MRQKNLTAFSILQPPLVTTDHLITHLRLRGKILLLLVTWHTGRSTAKNSRHQLSPSITAFFKSPLTILAKTCVKITIQACRKCHQSVISVIRNQAWTSHAIRYRLLRFFLSHFGKKTSWMLNVFISYSLCKQQVLKFQSRQEMLIVNILKGTFWGSDT